MRLFVALEFSNSIKKKLYKESSAALKTLPFKYKAVEENNLHITLHFLGETNETEAKSIIEKMSSYSYIKEEVVFDNQVSCFFRKGRKFPIFLPVVENEHYIQNLYRSFITHMDFKEERHFHPHLTIARSKETFHKKSDFILPRLENSISATAEKIVLFKSTLTQNGPIYSPEKEIVLK